MSDKEMLKELGFYEVENGNYKHELLTETFTFKPGSKYFALEIFSVAREVGRKETLNNIRDFFNKF